MLVSKIKPCMSKCK